MSPRFIIGSLIVFVLGASAIIGINLERFDKADKDEKCQERWRANYGSVYSKQVGCLVKTRDGRLIPEKHYQESSK